MTYDMCHMIQQATEMRLLTTTELDPQHPLFTLHGYHDDATPDLTPDLEWQLPSKRLVYSALHMPGISSPPSLTLDQIKTLPYLRTTISNSF